MKSVRILMAALLSVGVLCVATSFAEEDEGKGKGKHGKRGEEMKERAEKHFTETDADGSGEISLAEFKVMLEAKHEVMKEKLGDKYDPERAAKRPSAEEIFKKIDADENGGLSKEEMHKAHKARGRRGKGHGKGEGRGKGPGKGGCPNCTKKTEKAEDSDE
jgi:hypothetical protein